MPEEKDLEQEYQVALNIIYTYIKKKSKDNENAQKIIADLESDNIETKNKTANTLIVVFEGIFIDAVEYLLAFQKDENKEKEIVS